MFSIWKGYVISFLNMKEWKVPWALETFEHDRNPSRSKGYKKNTFTHLKFISEVGAGASRLLLLE